MYKVIDIESFYPEGEPLVTVIDHNSTKALVKQAADSNIMEYASKIVPDPSRIYVHIIAMGASGSGPNGTDGGPWPMNRNGDIFPEETLIKYHKTYEEHGYVYRNHINKNKDIAMGKVVFSSYNHAMARIEIVAWIDRKRGADIIERIEAGDFPATSMAARLPYDFCSVCGNKAHTRAEYCYHLRNELGKIYPDGRRVGAVNMGPMTLMDISIVVRPADVTSSVLSKVANDNYNQPVQSSAELAEELGLTDSNELSKQADISKLADMIKEIDGGHVVDSDPQLDKLLSKVKDVDLSLAKELKQFKLNDITSVMATLGISPSLAFLSELIAIKLVGDHMEGSGHTIAALMHKVDISSITVPKELTEESTGNSPLLTRVLSPSLPGSSLLPEYVEKRAFLFDHDDREDFKGYHLGTNIGFIGNGPHIQKTPFERWNEQQEATKSTPGFMKVLNTLLAVGGAALAMKWYISRAIEQKMRENASAANIGSGNGVKIILVKSASDYKLTYKLAKSAMVKCIKERSKI